MHIVKYNFTRTQNPRLTEEKEEKKTFLRPLDDDGDLNWIIGYFIGRVTQAFLRSIEGRITLKPFRISKRMFMKSVTSFI